MDLSSAPGEFSQDGEKRLLFFLVSARAHSFESKDKIVRLKSRRPKKLFLGEEEKGNRLYRDRYLQRSIRFFPVDRFRRQVP